MKPAPPGTLRRLYRARPAKRSALRGQSLAEYLVVTGAVAAALGIGMVDDDSVLRQLLFALRDFYARFAYALSLP